MNTAFTSVWTSNRTITRAVFAIVIGLVVGLATPPAFAQSQDDAAGGGRSASDVAHELANPNNTLGQLLFPIDYKRFGGELAGADGENGFVINFQPALPVPLGSGVNFFARPLIPFIVRQPLLTADSGFEGKGGLGDISFDVAVGKSFDSGLVSIAAGAGAVGQQQFLQMFVVALTIFAGILVGNTLVRPEPTL